ncbi:hypothetical protein [Frondihabitans cladoniiphilus]
MKGRTQDIRLEGLVASRKKCERQVALVQELVEAAKTDAAALAPERG